ncbi:hypothetical protein MTR67_018504 [Solanum verrucosum]|uniref:Uncharacterized protein n=1 Tax=Solanum verrucosum TaxID=315347 RepID=A0AAF0TMR4_SOLVR|nr:hypothetical protein MTR67_018504 [Solanum verrucosum]
MAGQNPDLISLKQTQICLSEPRLKWGSCFCKLSLRGCNTPYPKIEISDFWCYRWNSRTPSTDHRWTHGPSCRSVVHDRKLPQNSVRKFG